MKTTISMLATVLVAFAMCACGQSEATAPMSLAAKVVTIDTGTVKPENSLEVARASDALKGAAQVCKEGEERVGDMASVVRNSLKEKQIAVGLVELLEMIPQALGDAKIESVGDCASLLAMYHTARDGGQNHMAATNGMRGIIKIIAPKAK